MIRERHERTHEKGKTMTHSKAALASCLVLLVSLGVGSSKRPEERPLPEGDKPSGGAAPVWLDHQGRANLPCGWRSGIPGL